MEDEVDIAVREDDGGVAHAVVARVHVVRLYVLPGDVADRQLGVAEGAGGGRGVHVEKVLVPV